MVNCNFVIKKFSGQGLYSRLQSLFNASFRCIKGLVLKMKFTSPQLLTSVINLFNELYFKSVVYFI